jgi:hypothetical protein
VVRRNRIVLAAAALTAVVAVAGGAVAVTHRTGSSGHHWSRSPSATQPANPLQVTAAGGAASSVQVFVRPARPGWRHGGSTWVCRHPFVLSPVQRAIVNTRAGGYGTGPEAQRYYDFLASLDPVSPGEAEIDLDEAIWQFRLFERASLDYLGTAPHHHESGPVGLWDHTVTE